jgi:hypothetical protein
MLLTQQELEREVSDKIRRIDLTDKAISNGKQ